MAGGHPNLYLYCFNRPLIWKDPSGLQSRPIVIFVHGTNSSSITLKKNSLIPAAKRTFKASGHLLFQWSGTANYEVMKQDGEQFCAFVKQVKAKHPNSPIYIVAHSNGGNVATYAANHMAPIDLLVRLGTPTPDPLAFPEYTATPDSVKVFTFWDTDDSVSEYYASFVRGGSAGIGSPYRNQFQIEAGCPTLFESGGVVHTNLRRASIWISQIEPILLSFFGN